MAEERIIATVARTLRERRADRGMTLVELAGRSGVSRRMLTLIEKGEANPSLGTLERVGRALGLTFAQLVGAEPAGETAVVAPGAMPAPWRSDGGGHGRLAVASDAGNELWDWLLAPGDRYDADPDPAGGTEMILVTSGRLTLELGPDRIVLAAGHAVRFASDRPYAYVNDSGRPVRFARNTFPPPPPSP
ncbi:helix-turn-helix domain-containing protein [Actinomadura gamaensis]|uniref:Helix-turn-helix domain-containing protein n=1 Tax=Actinomadura gamaensis TaxID=1763541 RepID=A0ABV9U1W0_9ACTN